MFVISDAVINISVHNFLFDLIVTNSFHLKEPPHPLLFLLCSPGLSGRILVCSLHLPPPSLSDNSPLLPHIGDRASGVSGRGGGRGQG